MIHRSQNNERSASMGSVVLTREEVKKVIDLKETIDAVRNVYKLKSKGMAVIWPLVNYEFVDEHAAMDIRSGYIKGEQLHGLKMLNNFPENREKGLPPFNGIMMVYDSNTGMPIGIMDASYVTCMRTGAAGALGVDLLARKDARVMTVLGAGKQAPFQIAATLTLRPEIEKVYIVDPLSMEAAERFAEGITDLLKADFDMDASRVEFAASGAEEAVRNSDAIITVTPSRKPIIMKEWVKPGTHFSCLGSDMETKQEIESSISAEARIFTDDKAQCIRVGEIEIPIKEGVIKEDDIAGEIGDVIAGSIPGRTDDEQITLFDATGLYILDLVTAKTAIMRAKETGIGADIEF